MVVKDLNETTTPTDITPISDLNTLRSSILKNEKKNDDSYFNPRSAKLVNSRTSLKNKLIESITIHKGPVSETFVIQPSTTRNTISSKHQMHCSFDQNQCPNKRLSKLHPVRRSLGQQDFKFFGSKNQAKNSPLLYKASSVLPGTSNLMISQDIGGDRALNSPLSARSPTSERSSKILFKTLKNQRKILNKAAHKSSNLKLKTRNLRSGNYSTVQ